MNVYGTIRTFGVVVLLAAASVQCSKIHERMTDDDTTDIFRTTDDERPEDDVTTVRQKRSDQIFRKQFSTYGKNIDELLNPSDGLLAGANTPVWLAFTKPDGTVEYKKMRQGIVGIAVSRFYASHTDFSYYMVAANKTKRGSRSFEANPRQNSEAEEEKIRRLERQIREASSNRSDAFGIKGSDWEIIYPSVLIETDFRSWKTSDNDLDYCDEIIYQLAFWNAVDLRFRQFSNPKVRIRIAGIIIGRDGDANPHLRKEATNPPHAFDAMEKYWFKMSQRKDFPPEAYHMVVAMTDIFVHNNYLGIGKRGLCAEPSHDKFDAIGIVRDTGGFIGIVQAARVIGLILGLEVDTDSGDECDMSNGYIMATYRNVYSKNLEWSPCSLKSLSTLMRDRTMNCYDEPAEFYPPGEPVRRILPGDVVSHEKQCQVRGYTEACETSANMCTHMQCSISGWKNYRKILVHGWWCLNTYPGLEGTVCGTGRKCLDGVCSCMTADCVYPQ